ncbi:MULTISPECIES: multidrug efflux SMR transporter [unclassified Dermacoccus]|uniref:DMT family transporter n=1 Tax=unclassified Dermacoccus TaxID=2643059 RepID=UPI000641D63E|nr:MULTISPECIES: multidrug efflux SMR transporter [unclassified Dermacoccus]KLO62236.1 cation transporter [Dermacoccus sp. PE3]MBZ4498834.1 multidrug efflux SMR transporter [Dermacoccus sp. Tok2021]QNK53762.1 multidrug efflux SMR transporter [Dermacoccus sp. PAMC28757]
MRWAYLAVAIICEVTATLSLRQATVTGRRRWYASVVAGYLAAFTLLALTLAAGVPLGVAYGTWAACGVALTALASRVLFDEPLTRTMWVGIGCIVVGVLLIELGASGAH